MEEEKSTLNLNRSVIIGEGIHKIIDHLYQLEKVGIDAYVGGK